jgi:hypothetical protein
MKKIYHFKDNIIGLVIAAIISGIITYFSDISFWIIYPLIIIALVLNTHLLEYEDNLPGGFNNPDNKDK